MRGNKSKNIFREVHARSLLLCAKWQNFFCTTKNAKEGISKRLSI